MRKSIYITILLTPIACGAEPDLDFTGSESDTAGTETQSATSTQPSPPTAGGSSGSGSGSDSGSGGSGSGSSGSSGTTGGTGTTSGSSTSGTTSTTGTGSSGATSAGTGTGSGSTTGGGLTQKFPGDECDPFEDECVDAGGDYECQMDTRLLTGNVLEMFFQCRELDLTHGDGEEGARCEIRPSNECVTGNWCRGWNELPNGACADNTGCCTPVCVYEEDCGGSECVVINWQVDLADYLDKYVGIGYCG